MTGADQAAEARRVLAAAVRAALDGRDLEMQELLAEADHETLIIMTGGLAILASTTASMLPAESQTELREQMLSYASRPGRMAVVTSEERQRLLIGLLIVIHDGDERGFSALLDGVPRVALIAAIRDLTEAAVSGQLAAEDTPGASRAALAREALDLAARPPET